MKNLNLRKITGKMKMENEETKSKGKSNSHFSTLKGLEGSFLSLLSSPPCCLISFVETSVPGFLQPFGVWFRN